MTRKGGSDFRERDESPGDVRVLTAPPTAPARPFLAFLNENAGQRALRAGATPTLASRVPEFGQIAGAEQSLL